MTHATLSYKFTLFWSQLGGRLWQTIPGQLWTGSFIDKKNGVVTLKNANCQQIWKKGEPDKYGYRPLTITPGMVGQTILQFCKIELKTDAYPTITAGQLKNLQVVAKKNGYSAIVREEGNSWKLEEINEY